MRIVSTHNCSILDWDKRWRDNDTPWDQGDVTPALQELMEEKLVEIPGFPRRGRFLVPGCGNVSDISIVIVKW
jgi:hypothetical protein